jgi:hypothetical protein
MAMGANRIKYLEMLQAVITRMAGNQFALRAWSVALGTAIVGYAASKDGNRRAALLAAFPAVVFWLLDAYYLALEREFRAIFKDAAKVQDDAPDFSFDVDVNRTDLKEACKRPAVWPVHLAVLVLAIVIGGTAWLK